jgi:hypothetical protein
MYKTFELPTAIDLRRILLLPNVLLVLLALITPNFETSLVSIITLNGLMLLFYRPGIPLVVLGGLLFQWLQISIKVWHANFTGQSLGEMFSLYGGQENMETAFYLSSIGLLALSLGIYLVLRKIDAADYFEKLKATLQDYDEKKILIGYIAVTLGLSLLFQFRLAIPGLNTIIVAIAKLKWGFFLLYFFTTVQGRNRLNIFLLIIAVETVVSLSGYFSEFKLFVVYLFIAFVSFTNVINMRRLVLLVPAAILVFQFGVIWTAVKGEYRFFLSGGTDRQVVVVTQREALSYLYDLIKNLDDASYDEAVNYLVDRVSFVEFFSLTLDQVPENIPHEEGALWNNALTFYLKPRLFFPDKPVIDDSEHTSKYTGIYLASASQGASHSIGFMTDSYIDFGPVFMFVPIFFLGIALGWLFKFFLLNTKNAIWGLIFTGPFYLLTSFYSFNLIKVVGNLFIFVVVAFLVRRFVIKLVDPFLRSSKAG